MFAGSSDFYCSFAKPLLSMGTVGSMDCESRAQLMKKTILTKDRNNRMSDPTGVALLRGYENLRHMHAKKVLGKRISYSRIS